MKEIYIISNEIYRKSFGYTQDMWNLFQVNSELQITINRVKYDVIFDDVNASWFEIDKIDNKMIFLKKKRNFQLLSQA